MFPILGPARHCETAQPNVDCPYLAADCLGCVLELDDLGNRLAAATVQADGLRELGQTITGKVGQDLTTSAIRAREYIKFYKQSLHDPGVKLVDDRVTHKAHEAERKTQTMKPKNGLTALAEALDLESWQWLNDTRPEIAAAIDAAIGNGTDPAEIRRFVVSHTSRVELAARCEQAARHCATAHEV